MRQIFNNIAQKNYNIINIIFAKLCYANTFERNIRKNYVIKEICKCLQTMQAII